MAQEKSKSPNQTSDSTTQTKSSRTADLGQKEMQAQADREQEQGFVGIEVDKTPNENYTLAGVTSGAPTPETERGEGDPRLSQPLYTGVKENG